MATLGLSAISSGFSDQLPTIRPWRWCTPWSPSAAALVAPAALAQWWRLCLPALSLLVVCHSGVSGSQPGALW